MNMRIYCFLLGLSILSIAVAADDSAWKFEWDRTLPSLQLNDVSINAQNLARAWQDLNSSHMVRSILVETHELDTDAPFAFSCEVCTLEEVLDALCQTFGYQWAPDELTGVIWLEPTTWDRDILRKDRVEVTTPLRGVPAHTGILEAYIRPGDDILLHSWAERWLNTFDYPVRIDVGSYSIYSLLNACLVWNPSVAFYIGVDILNRISIQDTPVNDSRKGSPREGARLFWSIENGKPTQAPTIAELANWLGNESPRKRWAAQRYLGMTVWSGNLEGMFNHLSRGAQTETKLRALFSFVQWWLPKSMPYNMPRELDRVVNNALESEKFADYSPDTQLRLVSLGLARTNDPQRQEALLRKIQRSSAAALAEMDFDVRAFMNNHPAIEEKLRR